MRQFAWLELHKGTWYLLTDIREETIQASRKWTDKDTAISELIEEGWEISGPYPNKLSIMLNLGNKYRGFGLIRTIQ
jgi:hypothetical protein